MEIYYLLLNEVEIKKFTSQEVAIAGNINNNVSGKIERLLKVWSGKDWKVAISRQSNVSSLKDKIKLSFPIFFE